MKFLIGNCCVFWQWVLQVQHRQRVSGEEARGACARWPEDAYSDVRGRAPSRAAVTCRYRRWFRPLNLLANGVVWETWGKCPSGRDGNGGCEAGVRKKWAWKSTFAVWTLTESSKFDEDFCVNLTRNEMKI